MTDDSETDVQDGGGHGNQHTPDGGAGSENAELQLDASELVASYPAGRSAEQITETITLPAREGEYVPPGDVLPPAIASKLDFDLWSHQAAGLERLGDGENVVISTSTSSGKTLVYALAIARSYLSNPGTRALLVYPTKALSRDQERELNDLFHDTLGLDVTVGVYDGDTNAERKARIRESANVIITNFVGLNQYLESHHLWSEFFANCSYVVVDEAHAWTGLSGMHVAWVLRRLQRVLETYGSSPQYVLSTATIGNPAAHASALTGEEAVVIDDDGSPRGRRELVFWEPPASGDATDTNADPSTGDASENGTDPSTGDASEDGTESSTGDASEDGTESSTGDASEDGTDSPTGDSNESIPSSPTLGKRPATVEAPEVWAHLCAHDVPSLLFCDSRKQTELAVGRAQEFLNDAPTLDAREVSLAPYNAGHGKTSRRATENRLKAGTLDGVATTSALEVGINVGGVDGTVLLGYPGSRQSFWQRIGRSGRDGRDALSVFVPRQATLDEYVLRHPSYLLSEDHENAVVDLSNNPVYLQHVNCAAQELPLTEADEAIFGGDRLERAIEYGRRTGDLEGVIEGGVRYARRDRPQEAISFYATGGKSFEVRLAGEGTIDHQPIGRDRAYRDYHEGATVLYRGDQYQVRALREDVPQPFVELERVDVDYYTQSQGQVTVAETESATSRTVGPFTLHWGYGTVSVHYRTYLKRGIDSGDVRASGLATGVGPLELRTQLCWISVPPKLEGALVAKHAAYHNEEVTEFPPPLHGYLGGIHAIEHAMIAVTPLDLNVDPTDLGGVATYRLPGASDRSGWFIYDGIDGGLGFSRRIYEHYESVASRARASIRDCGCGRVDGCPACIMDDRCGNDNQPLYTPAATDVLSVLLGDTTVSHVVDSVATADLDRQLVDRRPPAEIS